MNMTVSERFKLQFHLYKFQKQAKRHYVNLQQWVSTGGQFCLPRDIWQCIEIFWVVTAGQMLLASVDKIQRCYTFHSVQDSSSQQRIPQPKMSVVPMLINPGKERSLIVTFLFQHFNYPTMSLKAITFHFYYLDIIIFIQISSIQMFLIFH